MRETGRVAFGWRHEFRERQWPDVRRFLCEVDGIADRGEYLLSIIDSVLEHGVDEMLALTTSMHDLVVALRPVGDPPLDVILVAAPGSLRSHPDGTVRIDHVAVNGENTEVVRPAHEALPLFWEFLRTEFGLASAQ
jgi:hypothetical protein